MSFENMYSKYKDKLRAGCAQISKALSAIAAVDRTDSMEDINERLAAIDACITYLQDVKRYLLYFKNKCGNRPPEPPKNGTTAV